MNKKLLKMTFVAIGLIYFAAILGSIEANDRLDCEEQPYCSTVNLTTLLHVCRSFFRIPCPNSCGQCASKLLNILFLKLSKLYFKISI